MTKLTLYQKVGKGIALLALLLGLISPTRIVLSLKMVAILLCLVMSAVLYWHVMDMVDNVVLFFKRMRQHIKHIRETVSKEE